MGGEDREGDSQNHESMEDCVTLPKSVYFVLHMLRTHNKFQAKKYRNNLCFRNHSLKESFKGTD